MTCIVGLVDSGKVYIGGDSASCSSWQIRTSSISKVFRNRKFIIGYTGSWRMGQLLQYHLEVKPQGEETNEAYMVTVFAEAVRKTLKDYGLAKVENNIETTDGNAFLVGYRGQLYQAQSDLSLTSPADSFDACGVGAAYALAVIWALDDLAPGERIVKALEAAEYFSNGVRGPFVILEGQGK